MQIIIESSQKASHGFYLTAACNNVRGSVGISRFGVQVVCHNAANRAWRGMGRRFESIEAAIAGYKGAEMRAIIEAAAKQAAQS